MPPAPEFDAGAGGATREGVDADAALGPGEVAIRADVTSSVWQVLVEPGARVVAGDRLLILESMKMEIPVVALASGVVRRILVRPGTMVAAGQILGILHSPQ